MIDDGTYRVVKGGRGFGYYVVRPATDSEYAALNERVVVVDGPFTTREMAGAACARRNDRAELLTHETRMADGRCACCGRTDDGDEAA